MNFVEPIRDRKKIAQIKNLLRGQRRYRDLLLFVVGINTRRVQKLHPKRFMCINPKELLSFYSDEVFAYYGLSHMWFSP
jgi:hypothetical protein